MERMGSIKKILVGILLVGVGVIIKEKWILHKKWRMMRAEKISNLTSKKQAPF